MSAPKLHLVAVDRPPPAAERLAEAELWRAESLLRAARTGAMRRDDYRELLSLAQRLIDERLGDLHRARDPRQEVF